MRFGDSPAEAELRQEVRRFLKQELPSSLLRESLHDSNARSETEIGPNAPPSAEPGAAGFRIETVPMREWRGKLAARGWIAPAWPKDYGGGGLTAMDQSIIHAELAGAGAPTFSDIGITLCGPTIIAHGTEQQRQEHLPPILRGETSWCQGLSESGSGSDLASLETLAVVDGDDYVINGTKIWILGGHQANWMVTLARTEPDVAKERGLSFFLVNLASPGIMVQQLVDMAGGTGLSRVSLDAVRVPARNIVGEANQGWQVATTTLDLERANLGATVGLRHEVSMLVAWAKANIESGQSTISRSRTIRDEIIDRYIEASVAELLSLRVAEMQNRGTAPKHEAAMAKLFTSELQQRIRRTAHKMTGLHGIAWDPQSEYLPNQTEFAHKYLNSVAATIAGGTSEIQRDIIAQVGLGMPQE